jgi:hypothetical protein
VPRSACWLAPLQLLAALAAGIAAAWAGAAAARGAPAAAVSAAPAAAAAVAELEDGALPPWRALAAARELMARVPAAAIEERLALDPPGRERLLAGFGRAIAAAIGGDGGGDRHGDGRDGGSASGGQGSAAGAAGGGPAPAAELADYLAAWARQRGRDLARRGSWTASEIAGLAAQQLVAPRRFAADAGFRRWVIELLPRELDPRTAPRLRDDLLLALERPAAIDFAAAEEVESAWGAVPRRSADRLIPFGRRPLRFDDDAREPIAASVFSLPSSFFDPPVAASFLAAVRAMAPQRDLVVLADLPLRRHLEECCRGLRLQLLETYGRSYTPWTRDPLSLVRGPDGGVVVLVRPNVQPGREEDSHLGVELVRRLPVELDGAWGRVHWEVAPVPFHNGQVLLGRDAAWISLHTLELRTLALLGLDRVPVASFAAEAGIERYFAAARRAAAELAELYGRPVRCVHPLPQTAGDVAGEAGGPRQLAANRDLVERIGGGAGYDLDSLLTLLPPRRQGGPTALVASLAGGRALLARLGAEDWGALRRGYDLAPADAGLAAALGAAQQTPAAARLDAFLDLIAAHLGSQGFTVRRLPLLVVPVPLLADPEGVGPKEFLITWNNVVLETRRGVLRAEGFSSLLPAGDREARRVFAEAGCHLDLLPALVHSIVLNGGYRCASNHLRASRGR